MEVWFDVDKKDVIEIAEKRKDCFPWGNRPDEKFASAAYSAWCSVRDEG